MKQVTLTNLILAGVVAALSAIVYWQIEKEAAQFEPPLTALDTHRVDEIVVRCRDCVERRFTRGSGQWMMQSPYAMAADDVAIGRLLAIAHSPVRVRHPLDQFAANKIGLDPPLMTVQLDQTRIDIGLTDALRGDRYVRVDGQIAMVPDRFSPYLVALPESELDRHLVPRGSQLLAVKVHGQALDDVAAWRVVIAQRITQPDPQLALDHVMQVEVMIEPQQIIEYQLLRLADAYVARRLAPPLDYVLNEQQVQTMLGDALRH
jgi:hypothetical protein